MSLRRGLPEHRTVVEVEDGVFYLTAHLEGSAMCVVGRLLTQASHRKPQDLCIPHSILRHVVRSDPQIWSGRTPVEVEREVVGGKDLAKRHRGGQFGIDEHVVVIDTESGHLAATEPPERIIAYCRDDCGRMTQPGSRDGHIGRTTAKELSERRDILKPHPVLQRIDVYTNSSHREHIKVTAAAGYHLSLIHI